MMKNAQKYTKKSVNKRIYRMMKSMILFLILCTGVSYAGESYAQNTLLSLDIDQKTVKDVFNEIEKKSEYVFFYYDKVLDVKRKVSIHVKNQPIDKILNEIFRETDNTYVISDRQILISKKEKDAIVKEIQESTQKQKVTGIVTDEQGVPLVGLTVMVKDAATGTITNIDGIFELQAGEGQTLVFSYIGYLSQTVKVSKDKSDLRIIMHEDGRILNEVVVTAMGIEKKSESLVYSTQVVPAKELVRIKETNVINSLQGKVSGMIVTPNAGGAGSASKVLLRGNKSILGGNGALIVLDGIPFINEVSNPSDAKAGGYNMAYSARQEGMDPLSTISPDDIESMTVLKGANAAALYGSDAGNGVVIINTKKGKKGALRIDVSSNTMFETPLLLPELQNTFGANIVDGNLSASSWGKRIDQQTPEENAITGVSANAGNNIRDFFNTGVNLNNSISMSGGSDRIQTYFSYNNVYSEGMIPNKKLKRNGFFLRLASNFLDNKLRTEITGNYISQVANNLGSGGTVYNPLYNLYLAPRNIDMDYYKNNFEANGTWAANPIKIVPEYKGGVGRVPYMVTNLMLSGPKQVWFQGKGIHAANNPYWLTNRLLSEENYDRIYGAFKFTYLINEFFDVQGRFNYVQTFKEGDNKRYATTVDPSGIYIDRGDYSYGHSRGKELLADGMINYKQDIAKDFNVKLTAGAYFKKQNASDVWEQVGAPSSAAVYTTEDNLPTFINSFYPNVSYTRGASSYKTPSYWSKALYTTGQISYRDFVYLDGSYRADWDRSMEQGVVSGKRGKKWYDYWSVGGNILLNELIQSDKINQLKYRLSFGIVANPLPNIMFDGQAYDPATGRISPANYTNFERPEPEELQTWETGIDLTMFDNKIVLDLTLYNSVLYNQYLAIGSVSGISKPINTGQSRNRGIETSLTYYAITHADFAWKTGINFAYNENKLIKTYKNRTDIYIGIGTADNLRVKFLEGGSYGDIYAKDFTRKKIYDIEKDREKGITDSQVGDIKLGPDGTPTLDSKGGHSLYLGNINAKIHFGWNNTLTYKNASLYFLIDGKIGGKAISFTEAYLDQYGVSKRTEEARLSGLTTIVKGKEVPAVMMPDGHLAGAYQYYNTIGAQIFPSQYVYDATNLRMREVSLGYTFRSLFGPAKDLEVSFIGRNLFFLYKDCPVDPDISLSTQNALSGVDIFGYPTARSYGVNLKMSF